MNQHQFSKIVDQTFTACRELLVVKGGEYAGNGDRLANFHRGAKLTGCTPKQVLMIYLSKHYDSLATYIKTEAEGEVRKSSEPIEGRIDDLINYCLLLKALVAESAVEMAMPQAVPAPTMSKILLMPWHHISTRQSPDNIVLSTKDDCYLWRSIVDSLKPLEGYEWKGKVISAWKFADEPGWRSL
jgi:hypothetical protein